MKIIGWKGLLYGGLPLGVTAGMVLLTVLLGDSDDFVTIHQGFYEAAAQMLPILLLAHMVRVASVRNSVLSKREQVRQLREESQKLLGELRDRTDRNNADQMRQLAESERVQAHSVEMGESSERVAEQTMQMLAGGLVATLIVSLAGGGAILTELAMGSDTEVIFVLTISGLTWTAVGLITFEILLLKIPRSLVSE